MIQELIVGTMMSLAPFIHEAIDSTLSGAPPPLALSTGAKA